MSNPGKPIVNPINNLVVTGNPTIDAVIRYALVAIFAATTGVITTWLNAHGFHDPNLSLMIGGAVASILSGGALALWGIVRTSKNKTLQDIRDAVAVQAGINIATSPDHNTPDNVTPTDAKAIIANFAPETVPTEK